MLKELILAFNGFFKMILKILSFYEEVSKIFNSLVIIKLTPWGDLENYKINIFQVIPIFES